MRLKSDKNCELSYQMPFITHGSNLLLPVEAQKT